MRRLEGMAADLRTSVQPCGKRQEGGREFPAALSALVVRARVSLERRGLVALVALVALLG